MPKLNTVVDLVSELSLFPAELETFRKDPASVLEKYGLGGKLTQEEIDEILNSKSLQLHAQKLTRHASDMQASTGDFQLQEKATYVAQSITVIECSHRGS